MFRAGKKLAATLSVVGVAIAASLTTASAFGLYWPVSMMNPFGQGATDLSEGDVRKIKEAMHTVAEKGKIGGVADWANTDTGLAGRAALRRVFQKDGRSCGEVEHAFTKGGGRRYVLPLCKFEDGAWKIMF